MVLRCCEGIQIVVHVQCMWRIEWPVSLIPLGGFVYRIKPYQVQCVQVL